MDIPGIQSWKEKLKGLYIWFILRKRTCKKEVEDIHVRSDS